MSSSSSSISPSPLQSQVIEPLELESRLGEENLLILDLGKADSYHQHHVPGAVNLNYEHLVHGQLPAPGKLPQADRLQALINALGISPQTFVVAYDDEGGGKAARLLWTLDCLQHVNYAYLNGGIHAWVNEGHPSSSEPVRPAGHPSPIQITIDHSPIADIEQVLAAIESDAHAILDVRSLEEYTGAKGGGLRQGHIPSAVHMDWLDGMDRTQNLRLQNAEFMLPKLDTLGITPDKAVIVYCYTHHRAAHSYFLLKQLGFDVQGYAGSWAEWGSTPELPIE